MTVYLDGNDGGKVRHGAVETNPIDGVSPFGRRRNQARGKVQDQDALPAFPAQVRAWANGEAIPGTPAYTCGPPRDWTVVGVVEVITGAGIRPHEVFALLLEDIDLDAPEPYLDVTGTLVEVKGKWVRKPAPKSDNGWRRILLPAHTVARDLGVQHLRLRHPRGRVHRSRGRPIPDSLELATGRAGTALGATVVQPPSRSSRLPHRMRPR
ncbi:hypothetical protein [Nocardia gipuzkoensis]|uniref:hypothetical protein n=1 Tax=Nocardia gipuzkoensis TaxID=2749991 RepID=UPI0015EE8CCB|nr:hypothetical protein [Nocardia gipuzkoensis]